MKQSAHPASRRLAVASFLLGIFILLDLALFGWLIFRSLSQREVQRVLFETRQEAEGLALELAGRAAVEGEDLYSVTLAEREVQTYIDSMLKQRKFVQTVEVVDSDGRVVFRGTGEATFELEPVDFAALELEEVPARVEIRPFERQTTFPVEEAVDSLHDLNLPIGELGFLHIGISQGELERSIDSLRSDLIRTTGLIAGVTLLVLGLAYLIIWRLWARSQVLEDKARESERLAYVGTLASGLAHEIRNPLNSLNLNMQLLEEELINQPAGSSGSRLMAITRDEIHRLEGLVTEFLLYAKPPPLDLDTFSAAGLLQRSQAILAGETEALGGRLVVEDSSDGAQVEVDLGQMTQLLLNLIQNALAAAQEKGESMDVHLRALREGEKVILEIEDQGVGMTAEQVERMFEVFYSTRKGGTGLGLAVVQRIARAHGASLEVISAPETGTRVRVILPLSPARKGPAAGDSASAPSSVSAVDS
jgi:signal transduction histidine kinase